MNTQKRKAFVFKCRTADGRVKYVTSTGKTVSESLAEVRNRSEKFVSIESV